MWFDIATSEGAEIDVQISVLASCRALAGTVLQTNPLQIFISVSRKVFDRIASELPYCKVHGFLPLDCACLLCVLQDTEICHAGDFQGLLIDFQSMVRLGKGCPRSHSVSSCFDSCHDSQVLLLPPWQREPSWLSSALSS